MLISKILMPVYIFSQIAVVVHLLFFWTTCMCVRGKWTQSGATMTQNIGLCHDCITKQIHIL